MKAAARIIGWAAMAGLALAQAGAAPPDAEPLQDSALIQALINIAQPGQVIVPPPGRYRSHIRITKPIIFDGQGKVTLDGEGKDSVLWVETDGAVVRNFHITNSGSFHNDQDAGIQVRGNDNLIEDNRLDNVLFGFSLEKSDRNTVRRNRVEAKPLMVGRRGDGIKLWYSNYNQVLDNQFLGGRDIVLWYSTHNRYAGNQQSGGRYGMHLMYAQYNLIENNRFFDNDTGISMMYDTGDEIRGNLIAKATGAAGVCIAMKESSDVVISHNDIVYCSSGIAIDVAPYEPGSRNHIDGNRLAYNDIAISFLNDWRDNEFTHNTFSGNLTEVAVYGGGSAKRNLWDANRWEDYQGFDTNRDGTGDSPHRVYAYAGRVWSDIPNTRFFKATPLLEVLDFLDRLAPFSAPTLLLEDAHPRLSDPPGSKPGSGLETRS
jgi:nitrous oxidase accessory protein